MGKKLFRLFSTKIKKDEKKTILIFSWKDLLHPYAGGGVVYIFEQAEFFRKQGYRVIFLTPRFKGSRPKERVKGFEVYRFGSKYLSYLLFPICYHLIFRKVTDYIIDIENGIPYFTPLFTLKPKIMLIYHVQKDIFFRELPWLIAWIPYIAEIYVMPIIYRYTKTVTISESTKKELLDIGFKEKNITLSYCGLDPNAFLSLPKFENPTLLYLGRVVKYKRIDLLMKLFKKANVPNSKLIIAGGGNALDEIKEKAKKYPNIEVLGRVSEEEKQRLFAKAWSCAITSDKEGWCMTVIEANACNTPTIALNVPGLKESIVHNKNGILAKDNEEFVSYIQKVLLKEKQFTGLIEHAKQFSWESSAKVTLETLTNTKI
jgi:glycosyltransferase involved in cell wall biosynthesis